MLQQPRSGEGAILISLLNSQFHSSLGTLPPLPVAAQHANQVNALCLRLLPHAGNTVSITRASQLLREMTARRSSTSFCGKCKRDFTSTPTVAMRTNISLCLLPDLRCSFRMLRMKKCFSSTCGKGDRYILQMSRKSSFREAYTSFFLEMEANLSLEED